MSKTFTVTKTQTILKLNPEEAKSEEAPNPRVQILKLEKPKPDKKVKWKEDVIDNEFMGRYRSNSKHFCSHSSLLRVPPLGQRVLEHVLLGRRGERAGEELPDEAGAQAGLFQAQEEAGEVQEGPKSWRWAWA